MNSSFDSTTKTNFVNDLIIENDLKSINTNNSFYNNNQFPTNRLVFKNNLLSQNTKNSAYISNKDLLKDTISLGSTLIRRDEKSKLKNKIINLNKDKYKDSWLDISSHDISKIILIKVIDQVYFEGHLILKNKLKSEYILGKFINDKNYYTITPSFFFIEPKSEIIINIKRFYKLNPDEPSNKVNDYILMLIGKTKNNIEDLNDVKFYFRKDDIYSPDYQLFSFSLILDNGYTPLYYNKLIEERKKTMDLFYSKTNVNEITDPNLIKENIEIIKRQIFDYKIKINEKEKEFESILDNIKKKDSIITEHIKKENNKKVVINEEVFYEVKNKKIKSTDIESNDSKNFVKKLIDITHDEEGITIPMLLFGLSLCLFIGKFIKFAIYK